MDKTSGENNGGYLNTIVGQGFVGVGSKKSLNSVSLDKGGKSSANITVTLCNKSADIKLVANKKIVFYVPSCPNTGPHIVTVSDGTHSDSNLTFTYNAPLNVPKIMGVHPHSSNPKLKRTVEIIGSNFGTNISNVEVFLGNSGGQVYQLRVLYVDDGMIRCGLPGGKEGSYQVQVNFLDGTGDAVADDPLMSAFDYSFQIDSISPSVGSFYGGTLLTITGQNFLTGSGETLVYVGYQTNWFCTIQSITETQITCLTPPFHPSYNIS